MDGRLTLEYVDPSGVQPALVQGAGQCFFVNHASPRRIDQNHVPIHQPNAPRVEQVFGFRCARHVQAHDIHARNQSIEIGLEVDFSRIGSTMDHKLHAEPGSSRGDAAGDSTIADEPKRHAAHIAPKKLVDAKSLPTVRAQGSLRVR